MATLAASAALVEKRTTPRASPVLFAALGAYAALVAVGVTHHEPWGDEAQAWQIVRDLPLRQVLIHQLHYEGHPSLWYLFLSLLQHLGFSYAGMHWPVALLSVAGVAILLFRSPFPVWARCALAFTFFLSYQYPIVARDYSLAPLLFFCLAVSWLRASALLPALFLGLLANLSFHCFAASIGFAFVYALEIWLEERHAKHFWWSAGLVAGFYLLAAVTVLPRPSDLSFMQTSHHHGFLVAAILWFLRSLIYMLCSLAKPWQLGLPMLALFFWSLWKVRPAWYLLPVFSVSFFSGLFFNFWHLGIFELTCIAAVWMAWPIDFRSRRAQAGALTVFAVYLAVHLAWAFYAYRYDYSQPYSGDAATAQFLRPYVAAKVPMAVTYVNTSYDDPEWDPAEAASVSYFHSVGLYPYFSGPLFLNEPLTYWHWSVNDHTDAQLKEALAQRPPLVVAIYFDRRFHPFDAARDLQRPRLRDITGRGYTLTHAFCGAKPEHMREREHICDLIFELR